MPPKQNNAGQRGRGPPMGIYHHKFTLSKIARHHVLIKDLSVNNKAYADPSSTGIRCYYSLQRDVAQRERSKRNPDYASVKSEIQLLMAPTGTNVHAANRLRRLRVILQEVVPASLRSVLNIKSCEDTGGPFTFTVATPVLGDNLWNYFQNLRKLGHGQPPFAFIWHVLIKLLQLLGTLRWGHDFNDALDAGHTGIPRLKHSAESAVPGEIQAEGDYSEIPEPSYPLLLTNLSFRNIIAVRFDSRPALVPRLSVVDFTHAMPHPSFPHRFWGDTHTDLLLRRRDWALSEDKDWVAVGSIIHAMLHTQTDPSSTVPDEPAVDRDGYCSCGHRIVYHEESFKRNADYNEERSVLRMIRWLCCLDRETKIGAAEVKTAIKYATEKRLAVVKTGNETWANVTQDEMPGFTDDGLRVSNAEISRGAWWRNPKSRE